MKQPMFRAGEIIDMAIQIEHQGLAFYDACVASPIGDKVEDVFDFLIGEKTKHIAIFSSMKDKIKEDSLPEAYSEQAHRYIDSFSNIEMFYGPESASQKASQMTDPREAVDFAIEFEKRSIDFYVGIKKLVRRSETYMLDEVITEQRRHIDHLIELRKSLKSQGPGALPGPTSVKER
jgi:rubrerythrin